MIADTLIYLGFIPDDFEVSLTEDGQIKIAEWRSNKPQPTKEELAALFSVVSETLKAKETETKQAKEQQEASIIEAKHAYARLQTIIDGIDTATLVQLRATIKILARDIQHLIRATIK